MELLHLFKGTDGWINDRPFTLDNVKGNTNPRQGRENIRKENHTVWGKGTKGLE